MVQPALNLSILFAAMVIIAVGYFVGSLSPSYLLVRRALGQDIRQMGDGNAGAENVSRILGLKPAVLVASIDIFKGLAVVLLARILTSGHSVEAPAGSPLAGDYFRNMVVLSAGAATVVGHSWSVYLKGRGGRGAATAVGALFGIATLPALLVMLPAFGLMVLHRSTTWGLATFFIGTVFMVAVLGHIGHPGFSWTWVAYVASLPAMVGVIHCLSLKRRTAQSPKLSDIDNPRVSSTDWSESHQVEP